jgi:hypothetical protein
MKPTASERTRVENMLTLARESKQFDGDVMDGGRVMALYHHHASPIALPADVRQSMEVNWTQQVGEQAGAVVGKARRGP